MNLTEIAININEAVAQSRQFYEAGIEAFKSAIAADKEAGEMLLQVKNSLPYGQFGEWVANNCDFTHRHANRLMLIAKNWEKITASLDTCVESDSPLLSLRAAIALASAEPKPEVTPEPVKTYKVAQANHECYGEKVEVVKELNHGDILVCKTSKGEFPFLKKELVTESEPLEVEPEIIDVEVGEDNSEKLREAIAIIIEYLGEAQLKAVLAASVSIGKDCLPSDAQGIVAKLISNQEMPALSNSSFA